MPATKTEDKVESKVRHEEFCVSSDPRIEVYKHLGDNPETGRSIATHEVERCMECGAQHFTPLKQ